MASGEDIDTGVYFTPKHKTAVILQRMETDTMSIATAQKIEMRQQISEISNDDFFDETYSSQSTDTESEQPSLRVREVREEYVFPSVGVPSNQKQINLDLQLHPKMATNNRQAVMVRPKKPVIKDIYDEDHYCLARNSGILTDGRFSVDNLGNHRKASDKCTRAFQNHTPMIIILIFAVVVLGGGIAYLLIAQTNKGILFF